MFNKMFKKKCEKGYKMRGPPRVCPALAREGREGGRVFKRPSGGEKEGYWYQYRGVQAALPCDNTLVDPGLKEEKKYRNYHL